MEAHSSQRVHRPCAFDKMEGLVREMQDPENGVPVRSQKQFLTSIPSAFMGYDLIEWLMDRLGIEESVEAVHIANQLCQYGYFFPVNDSKTLTLKDDSSLYRFQTPYYWPWQHRTPDNVEYAIYLAKRTLRNKQRHALEEYEIEALKSLRQNLQNKWDIIQLQAEEQVRLSKERKKGDKIVIDSQERAFWRVYRPPPGCLSSLEVVPVPTRARPGLPRPPMRKRTLNDLQREVELLRNSLTRTRIKVSAAIENLKTHFETYVEYDPMIAQPQPSNPWITDDQTFWQLNSPLVEVPTEKRVRRWALSMEEIMSDPTGLQEFTNYLRKEYSHENIRFWLAVKDLRHSFQAQISDKVNEIFKEFLAPGAPCEINIDGKTMEKIHQEMKNPSRFTFDSAAEHVYTLLLKKDCYPRFIRSDHYRNLLAAGVQPLQKKRFFVFGGQAKKKVSTSAAPIPGSLQQQHGIMAAATSGRRRGSDRSLSGSAHELAICGVRDVTTAPRVPHSHSQSNLTDIPYRDAGASEVPARPMDDVCPWDAAPDPNTSDHRSSLDAVAGTSSGVVGSLDGAAAAAAAAATASTSSTTSTIAATTTTSCQSATVSVWLPHQHSTSGELRGSSRKNSSQLDSCSSSSDVSLAIAETSERLKKSCGLRYYYTSGAGNTGSSSSSSTICGGGGGGATGSGTAAGGSGTSRNYSGLGSGSSAGTSTTRIKLSDTSRPSVSSSCNYPSPQQSFDLSHALTERLEHVSSSVRTVPEETEIIGREDDRIAENQRRRSSGWDGDRRFESFASTAAGSRVDSCDLAKNLLVKSPARAPLISISAIVGEITGDADGNVDDGNVGDDEEEEEEEDYERKGEEDEDEDEEELGKEDGKEDDDEGDTERRDDTGDATDIDEPEMSTELNPAEVPAVVTAGISAEETENDDRTEEAQVVPVWEPQQDQNPEILEHEANVPAPPPLPLPSPPSPLPPPPAPQEQRDNNVNEVCPWEDEDCRVDAPYVKTYATLGYL